MKTALIACAAGALLVAPGATAKPTKTDRTNAAKECRAAGIGKGGGNAFGKCVSRTSKEEAAERRAARSNAAKECKAERELSEDAFRAEYGSGKGRNAFGKCVSSKAKEMKAEEDAQDMEEARERRNAAKDCKAEREAMGVEAFREEYGTNRNKRNAFGKCVSSTVKEMEADEDGEETPESA